jgi:drug/metabolite transporter (DMT)-like permease
VSASEARSSRGALLVAAAAGLWGLWPVWARSGAGGGQVATIAFLVGGTLASLLGWIRARRAPRARPWQAWLGLLPLAGCDAANAWCYFRALAEGAVAPAVLSHYLAPVLVALGAPPFLGEPRARHTLLALGAALLGTFVLVLSAHRLEGAAGGPLTHALVLGSASAVFYAGSVLLSKRLAPWFSDAELLGYHGLVAGLLLLPITGLSGTARSLLLPAVGGLVSTLVAGLTYYAGLRRIAAERAGILAYLEPAVAVLVGWIAFAETPSPAAAAGGALVLAGALIAARQPPAPT